ncbi:uncharacterized protein LOC141857278 [Brevipalpus obovatus]|uniref:uncharacterized protein LOC141857278 n=1 Tax=Brevipalpus obovatus TaxID=246614 RepID=UPI003D9DB4D5
MCSHSLHNGLLVCSQNVPMKIDEVFNLVFTDTSFFRSFMAKRKAHDITVTEWQLSDAATVPSSLNGFICKNDDGQPQGFKEIRNLKYTMELNGTLVSSVTTCETQYLTQDSSLGKSYTIISEASSSGIPFSNHFVVYTQYCLASEPDGFGCTITAHSQVVFKKYVWGMKSMIEDNASQQFRSYMEDLICSIRKMAEIGDDGTDADNELQAIDKDEKVKPLSSDTPNSEIPWVPETIIPREVRNSLRRRSKKSVSSPINSLPGSRGGSLKSTKKLELYLEEQTRNEASNDLDAILVRIILVILALILILNFYLYFRLWSLEESAKMLTNFVKNSAAKSFSLPSSSCDSAK